MATTCPKAQRDSNSPGSPQDHSGMMPLNANNKNKSIKEYNLGPLL